MAYSNPFDVLADADNDFPSLVAANRLNQTKKSLVKSIRRRSQKQRAVNSKSNLLPNSDHRSEPESGTRRMFGVSEEGEFEKVLDEGEGGGRCGPRRCYRSTRRTCGRTGSRAYADEEVEKHLGSMSSKYRLYDRHNLFGRGKAIKREGFGRGNWGKIDDEGLEERPIGITNCSGTYAAIEMHADKKFNDDVNVDDQSEEDEDDDKEMTLDEYEKILEEKKKALQALLLELSAKNNIDGSFIKLDLENESGNEEDFTDNDNEFSEESEKEESVDGFVIVDAADEWSLVLRGGVPYMGNPGQFANMM